MSRASDSSDANLAEANLSRVERPRSDRSEKRLKVKTIQRQTRDGGAKRQNPQALP
jgi:hypothetical protein